MTEFYTLKFYRAAFGDTKYKDIPLFGDNLDRVKEEACEALYSRFSDMKTAGRGSKAPNTAALLDEREQVVARFEVKTAVPGRGVQAAEIPAHLWLDRWPGVRAPE
ncbi:hypothetical protein AJ87_36480 [Rhizobium yanglingense]|nr:hypothetical protein AJ87_36480 [Rhizobium yanglingense]